MISSLTLNDCHRLNFSKQGIKICTFQSQILQSLFTHGINENHAPPSVSVSSGGRGEWPGRETPPETRHGATLATLVTRRHGDGVTISWHMTHADPLMTASIMSTFASMTEPGHVWVRYKISAYRMCAALDRVSTSCGTQLRLDVVIATDALQWHTWHTASRGKTCTTVTTTFTTHRQYVWCVVCCIVCCANLKINAIYI